MFITAVAAMFKTVVARIRGATFRAEEEFADRSALRTAARCQAGMTIRRNHDFAFQNR